MATARSPTSSIEAHEEEDDSPEDAVLLGTRDDADQSSDLEVTRPLSNLVLYFMAIHFLLAFAEIILVAPLIKLYETSLCWKYYDFPMGGIREDMCKIAEIQRPLATIRGWKSMFDTIPGMVLCLVVDDGEKKCFG